MTAWLVWMSIATTWWLVFAGSARGAAWCSRRSGSATTTVRLPRARGVADRATGGDRRRRLNPAKRKRINQAPTQHNWLHLPILQPHPRTLSIRKRRVTHAHCRRTHKRTGNPCKRTFGNGRLSERMHHRPDELDGGEQQRVAIVRALANRPSIVLANKFTGDLDSKTGKEVIQALRDLSNREGATVIVVTHDPTVAAMATRVFEMRDGAIIKEHINGTIELHN